MAWKTSKEKIEASITTMYHNDVVFSVRRKRENVSIIYNGKLESYYRKEQKESGLVTRQQNLMLTRLVSNSVNKYILKNNFEIPVVEQKYKNNYTNSDVWIDMPVGAVFFYIDLSHCYWRIAWLFGIINDSLYFTYAGKPGWKTERNRALACIIAAQKMDYYLPNRETWRIEEDKSRHDQIHKNIRFTCWNLMGELTELLDFRCIGYRTDAMMVKRDLVQDVKDFLDNHCMLYTVKKCIKVSDKYYKLDDIHYLEPNDKIKRF